LFAIVVPFVFAAGGNDVGPEVLFATQAKDKKAAPAKTTITDNLFRYII
jgi:hypothetical protein